MLKSWEYRGCNLFILNGHFFFFFQFDLFNWMLPYVTLCLMLRLYMAYANSKQHLEILPEIWMMPRKLQFMYSFLSITHISEKDFQMLLAVNEGEIQSPYHALGHTEQHLFNQIEFHKNDKKWTLKNQDMLQPLEYRLWYVTWKMSAESYSTSLKLRKPAFLVFNQVKNKLTCAATKTVWI